MNEISENINTLISKIDTVATEYGDLPTEKSQFNKEYSSYADKSRITEPYSFGRANLRAAQEHLTAIPYLFEKTNIFALSVVARTVLEASSLIVWFLNPAIDKKERVRRGVIQLCDGKNQVRLLEGETESVEDFFENRLPKILRINGLEYRNRKNKVVDPHKIKPKISTVIRDEIGDDSYFDYRILSGIAHGQPVILFSFGFDFENAVSKDGVKEVTYKPKQEVSLFAINVAIKSYEKAIDCYFEISGWDFNKVKPAFDGVSNAIIKFYEEINA